MKRVYCLYRVSTMKQADGADIPMQRQACTAFAAEKGWSIEKEYYERGVSGFSVSANDRDAIQSIKNAAMQKAFDILLVFMFDRLGRRDDETPFVVEWFVRNGIAVWSVKEGEQRFDNHIDKLLNYIQFWQASGESIKTSIRVRTRIEQLTREGLYTGGTVPYGYRLVRNGRRNRQNREVYDVVVDAKEAEVVRLIYHKYADEGMGTFRLSRYLTEQGIPSPSEDHWHCGTVAQILKRRLYTGYIVKGAAVSGHLPQLQIVDDELFEKATIQREAYQHDYAARRLYQGDREPMLLLGIAYCGHCGKRLGRGTSGRIGKGPDGNVIRETRQRYICGKRQCHHDRCDGPAGYSVKLLEETVINKIYDTLFALRSPEFVKECRQKLLDQIEDIRGQRREGEQRRGKLEKDLADLHTEIVRALQGESPLHLSVLQGTVDHIKSKCSAEDQFIRSQDKAIQDLEYRQKLLHKTVVDIPKLLETLDSGEPYAIIDLIRLLVKRVTVYQTSKVEIQYAFSPAPGPAKEGVWEQRERPALGPHRPEGQDRTENGV